jgi:hypothetical protein
MNKYSAKCQLSVVAMVSIQSKIHDCMGERMQLDDWESLSLVLLDNKIRFPDLNNKENANSHLTLHQPTYSMGHI